MNDNTPQDETDCKHACKSCATSDVVPCGDIRPSGCSVIKRLMAENGALISEREKALVLISRYVMDTDKLSLYGAISQLIKNLSNEIRG